MIRAAASHAMRLLGVLLCLTIGAPALAAIPAGERAVLDAIYTQTDGAHWIINRGWNGAPGSECGWFGVICDSDGAHVIALSLAGDNLAGRLPVLDGLARLSLVYLGQNALTGEFPPLSGLPALTKLYIADNQLTGAIPQLARIEGLRGFVASGNRLSGPIPTLTTLKSLQYFDVGDNRLTGHLPNLSGMANLEYFSVEGNQLSGTIPALSDLPSLQYYDVGENQLVGHIPALTGLSNLQYFGANANQLSGNIPTLGGLVNLQYFDVGGNGLVGAIPELAGLAALETFEVDSNFLTGTVPSLDGLSNLTEIDLSGNGLTGTLPTPPASLRPSGSALCDNALTRAPNGGWDDATGSYPWYATCQAQPSTLVLSSNERAVATGILSTISARVFAARPIDGGAGSGYGSVVVTDADGDVICYMRVDATLGGACDALLAAEATIRLSGGYSGSPTIAPASAQLTRTTASAPHGDLDQHGWTGTWYNPATSGQGFVFEVYPDSGGAGSGQIGGGWFTFDAVTGGEDRQRWYVLSGLVSRASASATLDILASTGGNFNAGPVINSGNGTDLVGHAMLHFSDCEHGSLSYSFTDGSGRVGNIPMRRLDSNVTCDPTHAAGNGSAAGKFLLSGAWYAPSTSGQGILFDINPLQNITFGAWYTYAPDGEATGGGASQRWYTLQSASANVGTSKLSNIGIYSATGGMFDAPGAVTTSRVGTAAIAFSDCNHLTLDFSFTSGGNAGRSGSIALQRVGPTPAGCTL